MEEEGKDGVLDEKEEGVDMGKHLKISDALAGFALALVIAVAPGCVPVAVGTAAVIWQSLQSKEGCSETMKDPNFEAKMKDPKYREYFESWCGSVDQPKN